MLNCCVIIRTDEEMSTKIQQTPGPNMGFKLRVILSFDLGQEDLSGPHLTWWEFSWTAPVVSWFVFCTDHIFLVLCWTKKTGSTCPVNMGYKQCHFLWRTNWVFCHILLNKTNPRRCQINGLHLPLLSWTVQTYRKTLKYSRSKLDVLCHVMDETHNLVAHISTRVHYCSVRSPGGRFCYVSPCTYWSVSRWKERSEKTCLTTVYESKQRLFLSPHRPSPRRGWPTHWHWGVHRWFTHTHKGQSLRLSESSSCSKPVLTQA